MNKIGQLIICEGIDRVGKTTIARLFEKAGFIYFKDEWNLTTPDSHTKMYSLGKLDTTLTAINTLLKSGKNVVMDRFYMTEIAYTVANKRDGHETIHYAQSDIESKLLQFSPIVLYVEPSDLFLTQNLAKEDQSEHLKVFDKLIKKTKLSTITTSWERLQDDALKVMRMIFEYDFYLASPWFNYAQAKREERVKHYLHDAGFTVFSPRDETSIGPDSNDEERKKAFIGNVVGIDRCASIIAITDEKDMGTIWESGYAFGTSKPIVYYAETLGDRPFNLMLAESGKKIVKYGYELLDLNLSDVLFEGASGFKGLIE